MGLISRILRRPESTPPAPADVVKAPSPPPGARDVSGLAQALAQAITQTGQRAEPLPRDTTPYQFGPGLPLRPAPLDPVRPDSGRAEPRRFEYPVSWNLPGTHNRLVPWRILRESAERGLMRRCIEIRKRETSTLEWDIVLSDSALAAALRESPDSSRADVEASLRDKFAGAREAAKQFWGMPDRGQGLVFGDWLSELLEEHYVLDAVAIYPRYTYGGDLYALEVLDGSTIKPLLDNRGGRPAAPHPAYQQILYGFPRGEFVADASADGELDQAYTADQLIYLRSCVRSWTPYGYSAVEQALEDIDLYLKRRRWMRAEYTHGSGPVGMFKWDGNAGSAVQWSPEQIRQFERDFNDRYGGQTEERQSWQVLPPGLVPVENEEMQRRGWTPDYDQHLIKLVAMHFDVTMPELGISEAKGLGSSGWHEGQEDVQERKGTLPTLRWVAANLTDISRAHLGMPAELEFRFLGLDSEDEAAADAVAQARVSSGAMTLNERRDEQGLTRYDFAEADMPMVVTSRGVLFLEGASAMGAPGQVIGPAESIQEPPAAGGPQPPDEPPEGDDQADAGEDDQAAKAAELAAYRRWARKGRAGRPFRFELVDQAAATAAGVDLARVTFAAKASGGGEGPKARSGREWPGWTMDLKAARLWAQRLSAAMTGAIRTRALAQAWAQARKAPDPGAADARAWLASRGVSVTRPITDAVRGMWTDGYLIGERSAVAVIAAEGLAKASSSDVTTTVDWGSWEPGDIDAALAVLGEDGAGQGLQTMLDQAGVTIRSIAEGRMGELAEALSEALLEGTSPDELAGILDTILSDAQWSYMVAVTEISRAVSQATLDTYRRNGIEAMEWATAADQRVCPICAENEDVGPVRVDELFPSGAAAPPAHPMCFPAGVVVCGPSAVAATSRRYEGNLITIVFADGQELPVTPNHPVLTPDGWVASGDLGEGSQVLRARDPERVTAVVHPDDSQAVSRIEDVARTLRESGPVVASLVPAAAEDFHGDGAGDDQVEVVLVQRNGQGDVVPEPYEHSRECGLVDAQWPVGLAGCDPHSSGMRDRNASGGLVGSFDHSLSLSSVGVTPSHEHGVRPVPAVDTGVPQHAVDGVPIDTVTSGKRLDRLSTQEVLDEAGRCSDAPRFGGFGETSQRYPSADEPLAEGLSPEAAHGRALADRLAGLVEADRVIEVRRIGDWSGQVFNLETVGGWYFANGIVAHNCRCALLPVIETPAALA